MFNHRLLSIRGYNKEAMMIFADVCEGRFLKNKLSQMLENQEIEYIHLHNAKPGCYNCVVKRI